MRIIPDTDVFVSAVFFGGVPGRILDAWRDGALTVVVSVAILNEYQRVGRLLGAQYPGVDLEPILALVAVSADVVEAPALQAGVCDDADDDKFLACTAAAAAKIVVSGDKGLQRTSGWRGIEVLSPRAFCERYLH